MNVFVTGGTGFIGTRLVKKLLHNAAIEHIYLLVRTSSLARAKARFADELAGNAAERLHFIEGDLKVPELGVSTQRRQQLTGHIDHFFHLGAIYDLTADRQSQLAVNVQGTRYAVQFCHQIKAKTFHLVSSIASAGCYRGVFREDMFAEAGDLTHPYFATKHEAERIVRSELKVPYRIYRPAFVVGDSCTGEIDKADGPYYLFKGLQMMRRALPEWLPLIGIDGGSFNLVPVDFVVNALAYLAFVPDQDDQTFHLTDHQHWRFGELLNLFAHAAHAPQFAVRVNTGLLNRVPRGLRSAFLAAPGVRSLIREVAASLDMPAEVLAFIHWPTRYDNRRAQALLRDANIQVPPLPTYAARLWDYWERHLDPNRHAADRLAARVRNKVVLITGGSSGIGKATALRLAQAGAIVVICARDAERLQQAHDELARAGGRVFSQVADITNEADVTALVEMIDRELPGLHFVINNAGHSIRRSVMQSLQRLHDYERTMKLNYLAAISVILKCLPLMARSQGAQVINISSIGVLSNAPRFSAYVASKSALEAFSRCAAAELAEHKIVFSNINMPLVRTPMIAPTSLYDHVPTLTPEQAAQLVVEAIVKQPERLATPLGKVADLIHTLSPPLQRQILTLAFRLFPEQPTQASLANVPSTTAPPCPAQRPATSIMKEVH